MKHGYFLYLPCTYVSCFMFNSRVDERHYKQCEWLLRENISPGNHNVKLIPFVDRKLVLLPHLHIRLGLMKNFIKSLNQERLMHLSLLDLHILAIPK